jgi:hypothetical protein
VIDPARVLVPVTDRLEWLVLSVIEEPGLIARLAPIRTVPLKEKSKEPAALKLTFPVPSAFALPALNLPEEIIVPPV